MTRDEFNQMLDELNLNKVEFSLLSKVPYSTIKNWGLRRGENVSPIPPWVEPFLDLYKKSLNGVKV